MFTSDGESPSLTLVDVSPENSPVVSSKHKDFRKLYINSNARRFCNSFSRLEKFHTWTCSIILGQSCVLALALIFFFLDNFAHIPMHRQLAQFGMRSPRGLSYIVTAIATVVSALSTWLFSRAFVLLLTSISDRPISLSKFLAMSSLSRGAILFTKGQVKATSLTILALILLSSLTTSFTTLITPTRLSVNVTLSGKEISLSTRAFNDALNDSIPQLERDTSANTQDLAMMLAVQFLPMAAYASASTELGYPSVTSYLGTTFATSTGGILAAIPDGARVTAPSEVISVMGDVHSHLEFDRPGGEKLIGAFPSRYNTFQSGFTFDVQCRILPNVTGPTVLPNMTLNVALEGDAALPDGSHLDLWRVIVHCPSQEPKNWTRLLRPGGSMMSSWTCIDHDFSGQRVLGSQVLLLGGTGVKYNFTKNRACQFTPFYTTVEVQYTQSVNVSKIIKRKPVTTGTTNAAWASYLALLFVARMYPSDVSDRFGDDMASLLQACRSCVGTTRHLSLLGKS